VEEKLYEPARPVGGIHWIDWDALDPIKLRSKSGRRVNQIHRKS